MSASIIATGSKTIIDLSDGKSLSIYLGSNQPRTQIYDTNNSTFSPDWTTQDGKLVIRPVIYANERQIQLDNSALSITWQRREGSATATGLVDGESVSPTSSEEPFVLTVNKNKMADASNTAGLLTYIADATYTDPDTNVPIVAKAEVTFALIKSGRNGQDGQSAKTIWISGEQVFKYVSETPTPSSITLTAHTQNVTIDKWQYKLSNGEWRNYPTSTINGSTLTINPTDDIWNGSTTATIRVLTTGTPPLEDIMSIYKVSDGNDGQDGQDGQDGASASTVFLTNENITFAASKDGKVAAVVANCEVVAFTGTTAVTPVVGTPTGAPTGMTVAPLSPDTTRKIVPITISITDQATLGGPGEQNGEVNIPISSPIETTLKIRWSKVNTGATGIQGDAGENAVVFTVYAPEGTTFINQQGTLLLETQAYDGSTRITSGAQYVWENYYSGDWHVITGEQSSSYEASGADVVSIGSYRCTMQYKGKTYSDVITLVDKTDNYQAEIESTGGEIFKNAQGTSYLICRIWQNGREVDAQKSTTYGSTAPSSPQTGDFYYRHVSGQTNSHTTALMRYSGSAWVDVTSDQTYGHEHIYTWYRRDKNGNAMDSGASFATGKIIYIDGTDVDSKAVFTCEVS